MKPYSGLWYRRTSASNAAVLRSFWSAITSSPSAPAADSGERAASWFIPIPPGTLATGENPGAQKGSVPLFRADFPTLAFRGTSGWYLRRMPYALLLVSALLAADADNPCLPGAKLLKRDGVDQCVTPQGKLHGLVRVHSPTTGKVILDQRWENDQQEGPGHTWHDSGKMESESFYKA